MSRHALKGERERGERRERERGERRDERGERREERGERGTHLSSYYYSPAVFVGSLLT